MFERFTERARQVVVLAQEEARALQHGHIGTEHILLGLLREQEGLGCRVLESLDVTLEEARKQLTEIVCRGEHDPTGQIPFTPRAKKVLELSLREAQALGHHYIGTEHILLGLVREHEGVAAKILTRAGADAQTVRDTMLRLLGVGPASPSQPGPPRPFPGGTVASIATGRQRVPERVQAPERRLPPLALLAAGWVLFAVALGVGVLVGWAIWA